jgi:hypothetical protein
VKHRLLGRCKPPPLPPPRPATPPLPPSAPRHEWLDVVDMQCKIVAPCDDWGALMTLVRSNWFAPGRYWVEDADGMRVADLYVDSPGHWRIYSATPKLMRSLR